VKNLPVSLHDQQATTARLTDKADFHDCGGDRGHRRRRRPMATEQEHRRGPEVRRVSMSIPSRVGAHPAVVILAAYALHVHSGSAAPNAKPRPRRKRVQVTRSVADEPRFHAVRLETRWPQWAGARYGSGDGNRSVAQDGEAPRG